MSDIHLYSNISVGPKSGFRWFQYLKKYFISLYSEFFIRIDSSYFMSSLDLIQQNQGNFYNFVQVGRSSH